MQQLVTYRPSSTTLLELPALAGNVWCTTLERSTEVPDCLTGSPLASEENGVGSSRGTESKLVEGDGLTTGSDDSLPGGGGEFEGSDGEFW